MDNGNDPPCVGGRDNEWFAIIIGVRTDSFSAFEFSASVCPPAPLPFDCQPALGANLTLKEDGAADQLNWAWKSSRLTPVTQFGEPDAANDYTLCVYDADGRRLQVSVPGGGTCAGKSCWRQTGKGFSFRDPEGAADGVRKVSLKSGDTGKAKLLLKARGPGLGLPGLPLTLPVVAQLRSRDGLCWEANFPSAQRNDEGQFKARVDQP